MADDEIGAWGIRKILLKKALPFGHFIGGFFPPKELLGAFWCSLLYSYFP